MALFNDFYDVRKTMRLHPDADIYIVFGKRSNGKTYSVLDYCLERYALNGEQFAYVRRYDQEIRPKWVTELYAGHIKNKRFDKFFKNYPGGPFNATECRNARIIPIKIEWEDGKKVVTKAEAPMGYTLALNTWEHSKGITLPGVKNILFDEFLSREGYLPDEVNMFQQLLSSLIRSNGDVKVFMLANTVNTASPYFQELGLYHVAEMKPGTVDFYTSGDGKGKYVVEYTNAKGASDESDKYFNIFDNNSSRMIVGGAWETAEYPKLPYPLAEYDEVQRFYVLYNREMAMGRILVRGMEACVFFVQTNAARYFSNVERTTVHPQYRSMYMYTDVPVIGCNSMYALTKHGDKLSKTIAALIREGNAYYANNTIGEVVRNYLIWSQSWSPVK